MFLFVPSRLPVYYEDLLYPVTTFLQSRGVWLNMKITLSLVLGIVQKT